MPYRGAHVGDSIFSSLHSTVSCRVSKPSDNMRAEFNRYTNSLGIRNTHPLRAHKQIDQLTMTKLTRETALREMPTQAIIPSISIIINNTVAVTISADIKLKPINRNDITKTPAKRVEMHKANNPSIIMMYYDKPNEMARLTATSSLIVKYCS